MAAEFPGLITANLSGPGRQGGGKRRGVNNGRAFGQGGRKASVAKVWIQAALTKGTGRPHAWRTERRVDVGDGGRFDRSVCTYPSCLLAALFVLHVCARCSLQARASST